MADNKFDRKAAVLARMRQIPVRMRVAAREQLDAQAAFLVEQIRPNVPRDHGDLAESLNWKRNPRGDKIGVIVTEGADDETRGRKARAVEFGRPDMAAQPHFFPTYRAFKKRIGRAIAKSAKAAARAIWGGS